MISPPLNPETTLQACRVTLRGRVQGFGVRPAIARLALELGITGLVGNSAEGVVIHAEGGGNSLKEFQRRLLASLPPGTVVSGYQVDAAKPSGFPDFSIEPSSRAGQLSALVPPDVGTCPACLAEAQQICDRRYDYCFTTCTQCGPRYTLICEMPYDREATGMASFSPCSECLLEYRSPLDRRYHSQTNGCPKCGPRIWISDTARVQVAQDAEAINRAVFALQDRRIVALRGVGGYQLLVDATSSSAVEELRRRKERFGKPFAVMVPNLEAAEQLAILGDIERQALTSPANPIVVAPLRTPSILAGEISVGLQSVGLLLPTSPLHDLLLRRAELPIVVTSGNREDDPLEYESAAARQNLAHITPVWLDHDRPIVRPLDDSVVRIIAGRRATIRLARGFAPLPLELQSKLPVVALGAHQKVSIALSNGAQAVLGPHLGDLHSEASRKRYLEQFESLCKLYGVSPQWLIHDLHPDYFTTRWALEQRVPRMAVQHHHAHVAAGMLEHQLLDRQVLGVAWDGTGYGPDGTIWGGEFLLAKATSFQRVAHLRPFCLVGGDTAIREPWRVAAELVRQACGFEVAARLQFPGVSSSQVEQFLTIVTNKNLSVQTTSAGRLFDGLAALVLGLARSQFEGQPAMLLESACDPAARGTYPLPLRIGQPNILDWKPLVVSLIDDLQAGVLESEIAMKCHRSLAKAISEVAEHFREIPIILCGGCFQNVILAELVAERLERKGRLVVTPGVIPVNDGGIAAGQLAIAIARIRERGNSCA